jgi:hypothetical protein
MRKKARPPLSPRHLAEIGPRQAFKFTIAQWVGIAAQMTGAEDVNRYREPLEDVAASLVYRRQNPELGTGYRPPKSDKIIAKKIETNARNLRRAHDELSGFSRMHLEGRFGASRQRAVIDRRQRLAAFMADVDRMARDARYFLKGVGSSGPKRKGKADPVRIVAMAQATAWWEEATGKKATAFPKSDASVSRVPDGQFVRFLQAFFAAIPGESVPTGYQVSTFIRTYWAGRKKEYWLTGKEW